MFGFGRRKKGQTEDTNLRAPESAYPKDLTTIDQGQNVGELRTSKRTDAGRRLAVSFSQLVKLGQEKEISIGDEVITPEGAEGVVVDEAQSLEGEPVAIVVEVKEVETAEGETVPAYVIPESTATEASRKGVRYRKSDLRRVNENTFSPGDRVSIRGTRWVGVVESVGKDRNGDSFAVVRLGRHGRRIKRVSYLSKDVKRKTRRTGQLERGEEVITPTGEEGVVVDTGITPEGEEMVIVKVEETYLVPVEEFSSESTPETPEEEPTAETATRRRGRRILPVGIRRGMRGLLRKTRPVGRAIRKVSRLGRAGRPRLLPRLGRAGRPRLLPRRTLRVGSPAVAGRRSRYPFARSGCESLVYRKVSSLRKVGGSRGPISIGDEVITPDGQVGIVKSWLNPLSRERVAIIALKGARRPSAASGIRKIRKGFRVSRLGRIRKGQAEGVEIGEKVVTPTGEEGVVVDTAVTPEGEEMAIVELESRVVVPVEDLGAEPTLEAGTTEASRRRTLRRKAISYNPTIDVSYGLPSTGMPIEGQEKEDLTRIKTIHPKSAMEPEDVPSGTKPQLAQEAGLARRHKLAAEIAEMAVRKGVIQKSGQYQYYTDLLKLDLNTLQSKKANLASMVKTSSVVVSPSNDFIDLDGIFDVF